MFLLILKILKMTSKKKNSNIFSNHFLAKPFIKNIFKNMYEFYGINFIFYEKLQKKSLTKLTNFRRS
jgi:hypothetical protein